MDWARRKRLAADNDRSERAVAVTRSLRSRYGDAWDER
jgi:hypothetical protein